MAEDATQAEIDQLDEVRRYLDAHPDPRAIPFIVGLFADHMGWGIFQLFDSVLSRFSTTELTPHLRKALTASDRGTRWWAAHWALEFPSRGLTPELLALLAQPDDEDAHYFAIAALGEICEKEFDPSILEVLRARLTVDADPERRELLDEILPSLSR
jgi:hypothetical protein